MFKTLSRPDGVLRCGYLRTEAVMTTLLEIARTRVDGSPALVFEIDALSATSATVASLVKATSPWVPEAFLIEDRGTNGQASIRLACDLSVYYSQTVIVGFDPRARSDDVVVIDQLQHLYHNGVRELVLPGLLTDLHAGNGVSFASIVKVLAQQGISFTMSMACDPWAKVGISTALSFSSVSSYSASLLYTRPVFNARALDVLCMNWRLSGVAVDFAARVLVANDQLPLSDMARRFSVSLPAELHAVTSSCARTTLAREALQVIRDRSARALIVTTQNHPRATADLLQLIYGPTRV